MTQKMCRKFKPSPFYIQKDRCKFCVQIYCEHWVLENRKCVDLDPAAGSTYEVTEAHCKFEERDDILISNGRNPVNNWERLKAVTITVVDDCYKGKKFVNTRHLVEFVVLNPGKYPELGAATPTIRARVYGSIARIGWPRYTSNGSNQSVFIDPRCGE